MINRAPLKCKECNTEILTRTAIGHSKYMEFAFPCPTCGIEIRFGMDISVENIPFKYVNLVNADWIDYKEDISNVVVLDGESLIPISSANNDFSPFIATSMLANDIMKFHSEQSKRMQLVNSFWPELDKSIHFHETGNKELLIKAFKEQGSDTNFDRNEDLLLELLNRIDFYSEAFRMRNDDVDKIMKRIRLAEILSKENVEKFHHEIINKGIHKQLYSEMNRIRKAWVNYYSFLAPIFNVFYWDGAKHDIKGYTICQKRFHEMKVFYVDCYETFCRYSSLATMLEGIILLGKCSIPRGKGEMTFEEYWKLPNGKKSDILKNLPIIENIFVPYIDSKLRNGIGHHTANYSVKNDSIEYSNTSSHGVQNFNISYILFCEKVVQLYIQLETVFLYWEYTLIEDSLLEKKQRRGLKINS